MDSFIRPGVFVKSCGSTGYFREFKVTPNDPQFPTLEEKVLWGTKIFPSQDGLGTLVLPWPMTNNVCFRKAMEEQDGLLPIDFEKSSGQALDNQYVEGLGGLCLDVSGRGFCFPATTYSMLIAFVYTNGEWVALNSSGPFTDHEKYPPMGKIRRPDSNRGPNANKDKGYLSDPLTYKMILEEHVGMPLGEFAKNINRNEAHWFLMGTNPIAPHYNLRYMFSTTPIDYEGIDAMDPEKLMLMGGLRRDIQIDEKHMQNDACLDIMLEYRNLERDYMTSLYVYSVQEVVDREGNVTGNPFFLVKINGVGLTTWRELRDDKQKVFPKASTMTDTDYPHAYINSLHKVCSGISGQVEVVNFRDLDLSEYLLRLANGDDPGAPEVVTYEWSPEKGDKGLAVLGCISLYLARYAYYTRTPPETKADAKRAIEIAKLLGDSLYIIYKGYEDPDLLKRLVEQTKGLDNADTLDRLFGISLSYLGGVVGNTITTEVMLSLISIYMIPLINAKDSIDSVVKMIPGHDVERRLSDIAYTMEEGEIRLNPESPWLTKDFTRNKGSRNDIRVMLSRGGNSRACDQVHRGGGRGHQGRGHQGRGGFRGRGRR